MFILRLNYCSMKLLTKKLILIISTLFILLNSFLMSIVKEKDYSLIPVKSGVSHITVNDIVQDNKGFLWIGTEDGLNYFDGLTFKVYKNKLNKSSIANNFILSLFEDSDGFLWIGTYNGGLCKLDKKREKFIIYKNFLNKNSISNNSIYSIIEDQKGRILIGTYMGLNVFDKRTGTFETYLNNPDKKSSLIRKLHIDKKNRIWIGTNNGLFSLNSEKKIIKYSLKNDNNFFSKCNHIIGIFSDKKDNLIFSTHDSIFFESDKKGTFISKSYNYIIDNNESNDPIDTIYYDSKDQIWIASRFGNTYIYNSEDEFCRPVKIYDNREDSSLSITINKFYEERSGLMLIGTNLKGMIALSSQAPKFKSIRFQNKKKIFNNIASISGDGLNNLWLGTDANGVIKYNNETNNTSHYNSISYIEGDSSKIIANKQVFVDKNHKIWIGGQIGFGLKKYDIKRNDFIHFSYKENNRNKQFTSKVSALCLAKNGSIWGASTQLFEIQQPEEKIFFHKVSGIDKVLFTALYMDNHNNLWIGTKSNGLIRYNKGKNSIKKYTYSISNKNSLNSNSINTIFKSKTGVLWIGTDRGLNKLEKDNENFRHYSEDNGLLNNYICSILEDKDNNLWISTKQGINKLNVSTGKIDQYGQHNGIQSRSFNTNSSYKNSKGEMFFGTKNGIIHMNPEGVSKNKYIPPILFKELRISTPSEKVLNIANKKSIKLSYKNSFKIDFIALNYLFSESNHYAYILEGRDKKWLSLGNKNFITFGNLEPGKYKLKIKGSNNDLIWNEKGNEMQIIIEPPFWSLLWFRILVILFLFIIIFYILKIKSKNVQEQLKNKTEIENYLNKYNISPREKEIIVLIVQGKSNKEIEKELYISLGTVKSHVHNIFQKLNVNSRAKLIKMIVHLN